jgi:RNA 2',3'-cyclic 3'-phosphodiesterase
MRWIDRSLWHVTLRFLGSVPRDRLRDVAEAVDDAAAQLDDSIELSIGILAELGGRGGPLVARVEGEVQRVGFLHAALTVALDRRGWPPEGRVFRPHVTVARSRTGGSSRRVLAALGPNPPSAPWRADAVALVESELGRGGLAYTTRAEARFGPSIVARD